jgi:hypothetical protein
MPTSNCELRMALAIEFNACDSTTRHFDEWSGSCLHVNQWFPLPPFKYVPQPIIMVERMRVAMPAAISP